jgi:arylsulfatase A-like enzyme
MTISRRTLLRTAVAAPAVMRAAKGKPNVLFLFSDDQRFDTIGALGNRHIRTPNLDGLVERGASFTRAHIMGGAAPAVCVASRAMLLSGQSLFRADERLTAEVTGRGRKGPFTLMPEHFRRQGYTTFGTGKWHNRPPLYARSFDSGENIFFGGMTDQTRVPVYDFRPAGNYPAQPDRIGTAHSSEMFSDSAIRFLEKHDGSRPFFLYLAYTAPHDPRMAPEAFRRMYPPERMPLPANFLPEHPFDNGELKIRDEMLAPFPRTEAEVRRHLSDYYAIISHLDTQIGRVLEALRRSGHGDDTIIVFAGDNGLALGQHGLMGKQNLYDHSVRVPLVLAGPGIPRHRRSDALCYLLDIFPTLCETCGLPMAADLEGRSLAASFSGRADSGRKSLFLAYRDFQRGVTTGDWKLIRYRTKSPVRTQLFDLKHDPWERNNLALGSENGAKIEEMDRLLQEWMTATGDPLETVERLKGAV